MAQGPKTARMFAPSPQMERPNNSGDGKRSGTRGRGRMHITGNLMVPTKVGLLALRYPVRDTLNNVPGNADEGTTEEDVNMQRSDPPLRSRPSKQRPQ